MYFTFFIAFLVLALIIIFLGLYRPEHSEMGIIGFLFLFLLSFTIIGGSIEYKTGYNTTYTYGLVNGTVQPLTEINTDIYTTYNPQGLFSHWVGYYLAVMSLIGFVAVITGIKFSGFK